MTLQAPSLDPLRARRRRASLILPIVLASIAGCASVPAPTAQMAVAESAVQRAGSAGTSAAAPGELQIAIAKLGSARRALAEQDHDRARRLAEQADLDAQVAELHAQSIRSRLAAQESQDAARVLREEIARQAPAQ